MPIPHQKQSAQNYSALLVGRWSSVGGKLTADRVAPSVLSEAKVPAAVA